MSLWISKAEKRRRDNIRKKREENRQKTLDKLKKYQEKYKIGTTFKYFEIDMMLVCIWYDKNHSYDYSDVIFMVQAIYVKDGGIVSEKISMELFEYLMNEISSAKKRDYK